MLHGADSRNASDSEHGMWKYFDQTRCAKKGFKEYHSGPKSIPSQQNLEFNMASQMVEFYRGYGSLQGVPSFVDRPDGGTILELQRLGSVFHEECC